MCQYKFPVSSKVINIIAILQHSLISRAGVVVLNDVISFTIYTTDIYAPGTVLLMDSGNPQRRVYVEPAANRNLITTGVFNYKAENRD